MPDIPFSIGDAVILMILATSVILGFRRGFILETLSILTWAGAIIVTLYAYEPASILARDILSPPALANVAAALVIFVVSLIIFGGISRLIAKRVRTSIFGPIDRSLGVLFGLLRGAVIISFAYIMILLFTGEDRAPPWIEEGQFAPLTRTGAAILIKIAPGFLDRVLDIEPGMLDDRGLLENMNNGGGSATENTGTGYSDAERSELDKLFEQESE